MASWRDRVPVRLRAFFRGVFLLLAIATIALALSVLREEKQQSYRGYRDLFGKSVEQISARLQHPTGQLALLNPPPVGQAASPSRPLMLPFAAIDFDDRAKAQQAAEMTGCLAQYGNHAELCIAVGNNARAGGFIYVVGAFASGPLVAHPIGELDLSRAHRLRVEVSMRGERYRWIAPLEAAATRPGAELRGRLAGFVVDADGNLARRPEREFRGWLWQDPLCLLEGALPVPDTDNCTKRSFFSVRLPIEVLREELYQNPHVTWPPADVAAIQVHLQVLPPGEAAPLFDSDRGRASLPFTLRDLAPLLLAGEQLHIRKLGGNGAELISLVGAELGSQPPPLLSRIIRRLPVAGYDLPVAARQTIATPMGEFGLDFSGDVRGIDRALGLVASRLSWFVAAMLAAIVLAWLAIEIRIIRRITLLTTRAASVKRSVHASEGLIAHDLQGLRGRDELGLLAGVLSDLLQRINEDVKREQIRTQQEQDMWHAVGHEILSPLQSLMALHPAADDPSQRYIHRMQRAVRVLYGSASPGEAILSANVQISTLDVHGFLQRVADNAEHAGIPRVTFQGGEQAVIVKADEHSLEDVITHVLSNAARYRTAGTAIEIELRSSSTGAEVRIYNEGPAIDAELLERIFEYGVSDATDSGAHGNRGQGLFVAKTYMAKMGGTIAARNLKRGVEFVLTLALA